MSSTTLMTPCEQALWVRRPLVGAGMPTEPLLPALSVSPGSPGSWQMSVLCWGAPGSTGCWPAWGS